VYHGLKGGPVTSKKLTAPPATELRDAEFGFSVALSSTAATALVGGPSRVGPSGNRLLGDGAWVFGP